MLTLLDGGIYNMIFNVWMYNMISNGGMYNPSNVIILYIHLMESYYTSRYWR